MERKTSNRFSQGSRLLLYIQKGIRMTKPFRRAALILLSVLFGFSLFPPLSAAAADRLQEVSGRPVIVIDPGHGGKNQGTIEGSQEEKYMTMTTALAMYEELCKYDDVDVYLTRTGDMDLTLKERAQFAESVGADFLFSIHYNASEEHTLFGAEIWIPSTAPFNGYGYQFGHEFLRPLQERGIFLRGIKTRLNDKGEDYYGIIRESAALEIPAVILEHCHVDESRDIPFCDSEEDLVQFGREDATAVAKYFGLKSSILNVDYSGFQLAEARENAPMQGTLQDTTPPDVCILEFVSADYEQGTMSLTVSAADYDTPLLYYDYSIDGGVTYSPRNIWPGSNALDGSYEDTFTLSLLIPDGEKPTVILRAYNLFGLYTLSNSYESIGTFSYPKPAESPEPKESLSESREEPRETEESEDLLPAASGTVKAESQPSFLTFLEICLVVVVILFVLLLVSQIIARRNRKRRRCQQRKVAGDSRSQHR